MAASSCDFENMAPASDSVNANAYILEDKTDKSLLNDLFSDLNVTDVEEESQCLQYLDKLASFGVHQLGREPERLEEETTQTLEQTQSLAFKHYRTFIKAAECSREIYKDINEFYGLTKTVDMHGSSLFNIIERSLHSLLDNLPTFTDKVNSFSKTSQEINFSRKQDSLVLARHTQLLEILEIPQLMDTCVRNNYYEEALELANYVKRLEKKFSSIKIILDISKHCKNTTRLMLTQLLQQLKGNIQLPACLRIIGYLRQLEAFTEAELRIKFLQARDFWFQSVLSAIPTKDAYYHITKVIEASRVHLFDIVTQYRAIFSDEDPIFMVDDDEKVNYANILHSWMGRKIMEFIAVLERDLERSVGSRLDSVFGQCMYFGLSFSRVGADFRGLLIPTFHRVVMRTFTKNIELATRRLEDSMATYKPSSLSKPYHERLSGMSQKTKGSTEGSLSPPQDLLDFPPLAQFTNGILSSFNDLRHYAAIPLSNQIKNILQKSLERITMAISAWARLESQSFPEKQRQYVHQLCKVTAHEFLPYINRCLEAVFQPKAIAEVLGKPSHSTDFSDSGGDNCTLEINKLARVLGEFLPNEATDQGVVTDFKPNTTDIDLKSKESLDTQNELDVQNTKLRTEVISDSSDSNQTNRKISVEP